MSLIEKVEKLPPEERRKIIELLKTKDDQSGEGSDCKPDASTSWMYEPPKKSAEDFLLGKAIRSLEELTDVNRDQEEETPIQRLTRLDMEAKFREDPLNLMRQHEMDKRSALLQNTARMKKLQRLIEMQNEAKQKAEKRKEKKRLKKEQKRKKRKRRISASSSSIDSSENSEDDAILEKFISLIKKVDEVKKDGSLSALEKSESEKEKKGKKRHKNHHHRHHSKIEKGDPPQSPKTTQTSSLSLSGTRPQHRSRPVSSKGTFEMSRRHNDISRRRSHSRSPGVPNHRHFSPPRVANPSGPGGSKSGSRLQGEGKQKLTQEEMAILREQMAADAKERDAERQRRFEQHQSEKTKEENEESLARVSHGASFLRGLTLSHVASTTVVEVVQRNASKRQRGGMDQSFLRR
ncbi:hypothetical protein Aperf_G00000024574 [Anoplocephala perfoliata]